MNTTKTRKKIWSHVEVFCKGTDEWTFNINFCTLVSFSIEDVQNFSALVTVSGYCKTAYGEKVHCFISLEFYINI